MRNLTSCDYTSSAHTFCSCQVEYPDGQQTLCIIPAKFNKKLWVRRGGYLIIDDSIEALEDESSRVTGTIVQVLYDDHVKELKRMPGVW